MARMTKTQVKEILDRVLTWAPEDQEKVAQFVREVEQRRASDDITDEEWKIIDARAAIWQPTKRSSRCSIAIGVHEAPI